MTTLHAHALARQPGFRAATFRLRAHAVTGMRDDLPGISRHRIGANEKAARLVLKHRKKSPARVGGAMWRSVMRPKSWGANGPRHNKTASPSRFHFPWKFQTEALPPSALPAAHALEEMCAHSRLSGLRLDNARRTRASRDRVTHLASFGATGFCFLGSVTLGALPWPLLRNRWCSSRDDGQGQGNLHTFHGSLFPGGLSARTSARAAPRRWLGGRSLSGQVRQWLPPHGPVDQPIRLISPAQGCCPGNEHVALVVGDKDARVRRRRFDWLPTHGSGSGRRIQ